MKGNVGFAPFVEENVEPFDWKVIMIIDKIASFGLRDLV